MNSLPTPSLTPFRPARCDVSLSAAWREVHQEFPIGTRWERALQFSLDDHCPLSTTTHVNLPDSPGTEAVELCYQLRFG